MIKIYGHLKKEATSLEIVKTISWAIPRVLGSRRRVMGDSFAAKTESRPWRNFQSYKKDEYMKLKAVGSRATTHSCAVGAQHSARWCSSHRYDGDRMELTAGVGYWILCYCQIQTWGRHNLPDPKNPSSVEKAVRQTHKQLITKDGGCAKTETGPEEENLTQPAKASAETASLSREAWAAGSGQT